MEVGFYGDFGENVFGFAEEEFSFYIVSVRILSFRTEEDIVWVGELSISYVI